MTDLDRASVEVIRRGQHASGGYVAALGYPTYRYAWVRDGTFAAQAMDAVGEHESAAAFHRFVAGAVERSRPKVEALGRTEPAGDGVPPDEVVLHTRFTLEGEEGTEPWSNFQLDGYGFWLSGLAMHLEATGADARPFLPAVDLVSRYLAVLWERPCWSCWEEHPDRRHPTTLAAVAAGLRRAAALLDDGEVASVADGVTRAVRSMTTLGALARNEHSTEVDGSALLVIGPFGPFGEDDPIPAVTVARIETDLVADGGGVHRNLSDTFYGGGLWVPLAGALAWWYGPDLTDRADEVLAWIEGTADVEGNLPEQVPRRLLHPQMEQSWIDRWGPVASPLLWSHAMFLLARSARA
jgi:GH15 family glucan-1,4-alpha-glucosidase